MSRLRERELLMLRNTRPFNVLGLPGISVPCGETSAGLPVALQIAGPAGKDAQVLAFARGFEEKADSSHALSRRAPSRGSE
jgi:Asp-tRNA(Asn)/Glu-tRNA(Gln) amidotransferase A subunit family amidase